jgi:hypothetical protein
MSGASGLLISGEHRLLACCRRHLADDSQRVARIHDEEHSISFSAGCRKEQVGSLCSPEKRPLSACGIAGFWLGSARGLEAENRFAFFHQIKTIARHRFQIGGVSFKQIDLAVLTRQQVLLLGNLLLQVVNFCAAPHQFFVRRNKQAYDDEPDRQDQQNPESSVQSLPHGGLATRTEIGVSLIHLAHCSAVHRFVTKFFFNS